LRYKKIHERRRLLKPSAQLDAGYAIGTVNHALSTIKAHAKLALKSGALDAAAFAPIKTVGGSREAPRRPR
jgi:hypothetical protein